MRKPLSIGRLLTIGLLMLVAMGMIAPMAWMILVSLRSSPEQFTSLGEMIAAPTVMVNYADAWTSDNFLEYFLKNHGCPHDKLSLKCLTFLESIGRFRPASACSIPWRDDHSKTEPSFTNFSY